MDEIKKIILDAGKILKSRYFNSFTLYEKEKGHIASDVNYDKSP